MGFMGSAFSQGLGGLGAGMSEIGNKYIDQALTLQRAQALVEMRRKSENDTRADTFAFENDPANVATASATSRTKALAAGQSAQAVALSAASNEPLQSRLAANAGRTKRAEADNTAHDVAPGGEVVIGTGKNLRPTAQEVQSDLYKLGLKGIKGGLDKMSEVGKQQLLGIVGRAREMEKTIDKGLGEGTLSKKATTADGKPDPGYDRYVALMSRQAELGLQRMRVLDREGELDGAQDAMDAIEEWRRGGQDPGEVQSLSAHRRQAAQIGGNYAKEYLPIIDQAIQESGKPGYAAGNIAADAVKTGTTRYDVNVGGKRSSVGGPVPPDGTGATAGAPVKPMNRAELMADDERSGQESLAKQAARTVAETAAKSADKAKRTQEASVYTLERVKKMKPDEAAEVYGKYRDVLQPEVVAALRRRQ